MRVWEEAKDKLEAKTFLNIAGKLTERKLQSLE